MSEADSIFTKIINGEIPAHKVYEDDTIIAILDIHPVHPGHTLVIPKKQVDEFQNLDDETYQHLMDVVKLLSQRIKERLKPARVGLIVEGFIVPHVHVHLIPLKSGADIKTSRSHGDMETEPDNKALAEIAGKLS